MTIVLHVTECYGGGVARALKSRISATPEHRHHLLWAGEETPAESDGWASINKMPRGFISRISTLRGYVSSIRPDVLHAHSSWAGVYSRVIRIDAPVFYEPHCFKFDDPQLNAIPMAVYKWAEKILAHRTAHFGVLSSHEERLTYSLRKDAKVVRIPNVPTVDLRLTSGTKPSQVVMVGRLARQKDPEFFAEVVKNLRASGSALKPVWIGSGDTKYLDLLKKESIEVTGWLNQAQIEKHLDVSVYVHTASYEGFPLSVLDAAARGCPMVLRRIPPFQDYPLNQGETPQEIADHVVAIESTNASISQAVRDSKVILESHNVDELRRALNIVYAGDRS